MRSWILPLCALALCIAAYSSLEEKKSAAVQAGGPTEKFDAEIAKAAAATVAYVAAQEVREEPTKNYELPELEQKIQELDSYLDGKQFVERANKGELNSAELLEFRKALALRVKYFEQKANYLLNET